MPAIGFEHRFVVAVWTGEKRQSIRPPRVRSLFEAGSRLSMFAGWRTTRCVRIAEAEIRSVARVRLECESRLECQTYRLYVRVGSQWLQEPIDAAARRDGFTGPTPGCDLAVFLERKHGPAPFEGHLVTWGELAWRCSSRDLDGYLAAHERAEARKNRRTRAPVAR
jgi:hypothetical protein